MRIRHLVPVVALVAVATSMPAQAAKPKPKPKPPPPVCKLIQDDEGDGVPYNTAGAATVSDPNLDVVSGDVVTDATRLTAVIRLKDLTDTNPQGALGRRYLFQFVIGTTTVGLVTTVGPLGVNYPPGTIKGVVDAAANEVRVTLPLTEVRGVLIKKGMVLQHLEIRTNTVIGLRRGDGLGDGIDLVPHDKTVEARAKNYVAGTPSCVKMGL